MATELKTTPLRNVHIALGAKMVPFAGYEMPVQYSGIIDEHMSVRQTAGLFDVSHMGEIMVQGEQAFEFVQNLVSNDASKLYDGRVMYAVMCNEHGGIVDDLLVYRFAQDNWMLVVNASNIEKDWAWMQAHNPMNATLKNFSDDMSLLAIQGPKAFEIVQSLTDIPLEGLKYYHCIYVQNQQFLNCQHAVISHTGYTGEAGLEIYCENESAERVWNALMEAGAALGLKPAGLGARDTLRLESGYCLYGNDINDDTNPLEAGLGWVTKLDKGAFVGRDAVIAAKADGIKRRLVAFVMEEKAIPRHGYPILSPDGAVIGEVTSGSQSPILGKGIGLGYVQNLPAFTAPQSAIAIQIRGKSLQASIQKPPLHKLA
jgi:aminomethyltransferase